MSELVELLSLSLNIYHLCNLLLILDILDLLLTYLFRYDDACLITYPLQQMHITIPIRHHRFKYRYEYFDLNALKVNMINGPSFLL